MSGRLKVGQWCPLHRSKTCPCHPEPVVRERKPKIPTIRGVKKLPDGREKCSPSEITRRKNMMLVAKMKCMACHGEFGEYSDVELGHFASKGMNGSKRNDAWGNIGLIHAWTNRDQGSMSLEDYLKKLAEKGVKPCQQ